jgi:hypothetical protein
MSNLIQKIDTLTGENLLGKIQQNDIAEAVTLDKHFVHEQNSASNHWVIIHNLGKIPAIQCYDSQDRTVFGEIIIVTQYIAEVKFKAPFSGKAICN